MKYKGLIAGLAIALFSFTGIQESYSQVVIKLRPATPKIIVTKPKKPGRNFFWVEGQWKWNQRHHKYVWNDGHWEKKRRGKTYVPGHWTKVPGGHKWVPGRWR